MKFASFIILCYIAIILFSNCESEQVRAKRTTTEDDTTQVLAKPKINRVNRIVTLNYSSNWNKIFKFIIDKQYNISLINKKMNISNKQQVDKLLVTYSFELIYGYEDLKIQYIGDSVKVISSIPKLLSVNFSYNEDSIKRYKADVHSYNEWIKYKLENVFSQDDSLLMVTRNNFRGFVINDLLNKKNKKYVKFTETQ